VEGKASQSYNERRLCFAGQLGGHRDGNRSNEGRLSGCQVGAAAASLFNGSIVDLVDLFVGPLVYSLGRPYVLWSDTWLKTSKEV
jgi:hypothetical protein